MEHNNNNNNSTHYVVFGITTAVVLVSVLLVYRRISSFTSSRTASPRTQQEPLQPTCVTAAQNKEISTETQVSNNAKVSKHVLEVSPSKKEITHSTEVQISNNTKVSQHDAKDISSKTVHSTEQHTQFLSPTKTMVTAQHTVVPTSAEPSQTGVLSVPITHPTVAIGPTSTEPNQTEVILSVSTSTLSTISEEQPVVTVSISTVATALPSEQKPVGTVLTLTVTGNSTQEETINNGSCSVITERVLSPLEEEKEKMRQDVTQEEEQQNSEKKKRLPKLELPDALASLKSPTRRTVSSPPSSSSNRHLITIPSLGGLEQLPREGKGGAKSFRRRAVAQWDYVGPSTYENKPVLQFKAGDEIRVIQKEIDSGWGWGELNDEEGYFPLNYTKIGGPPTIRLDGNVSPMIRRLQGKIKHET